MRGGVPGGVGAEGFVRRHVPAPAAILPAPSGEGGPRQELAGLALAHAGRPALPLRHPGNAPGDTCSAVVILVVARSGAGYSGLRLAVRQAPRLPAWPGEAFTP